MTSTDVTLEAGVDLDWLAAYARDYLAQVGLFPAHGSRGERALARMQRLGARVRRT